MKDCGIFSIFYKNYNYGGQLQAYAMCKVLEKLGYETEQICFVRSKSFFLHKVKVVLNKSHKEKKDLLRRYFNRFLVKFGFCADYSKKIIRKFDEFINQVPHSEIYSKDNISDSNNRYRLFVSGSDQVWNPDTCSDEWFLNFLYDNKPRIAYSASIGKEYFTSKEINRLKTLIEKYKYIGVREDKAKKLLQGFIDRDIKVVLDPVMLLTRSEWAIFDKWDFLKKERYLCVYLVAYNKEIEKQALEYAKLLNLKAVFITDPRNALNQNPNGYWMPFDDGVGPTEFIALFLNAELIITNSFHGMALCINFEKEFFGYYSREINDKNTLNSRIDTLLNTFDLKDRLVSTLKHLSVSQLKTKVKYKSVCEKVYRRREDCINYLSNSIIRSISNE